MILSPGDGEDGSAVFSGTSALGSDPDSGQAVTLRAGPYGPYVQLGEAVKGADKPKRASLPKVCVWRGSAI